MDKRTLKLNTLPAEQQKSKIIIETAHFNPLPPVVQSTIPKH